MKSKVLIACASLQLLSLYSHADIIEFHIAKGTQNQAWNTRSTPIRAKVGDTIRIFNDDTLVHRLHTYGSPCEHGPNFNPGTSYDCLTTSPYSSSLSGPLYDHDYGESAEIWFEVLE